MKGFILLLALYASSASADLITIRAADYAPGTNVSNIDPGVTFTALSEAQYNPGFDPTYSNVYAYTDGFGLATSDGSRPWLNMVEAYQCMRTGEYLCGDPYQLLQVDFTDPVSYFEIANYWWSDGPRIYVFDTQGQIIAQCTSGSGGCQYTLLEEPRPSERYSLLEFTSSTNNIARLWIGGHSGRVGVQSLSYSVPEPATAGLLGLGLVGVMLARRRRRPLS